MVETGREIDLDIVSASWRALSDGEAYDSMMSAWERKFDAITREPRIPLIDGALKRQLASIEELLLEDRNAVQTEDPFEAAVSQTPAPAMVLSPNGLVTSLNEGASEYFGVQHGLNAGTDWIRDESLADFRAVRASGVGKGNVDYAIIRIIVGDGQDALAEVYQLESAGAIAPYTVVRSLELDWLPSVTTALRKVFGFTKAESEICRLLFAYRDLQAVADQRGVTIETVRTQVKRILSKAEVHSKAELVRLLALLCARAAFQQDRADLTWSDPLGREQILTRRDGRKLAYSWMGAEAGRPVLFVAGQTSFSFLTEAICAELERRDIKLISPSLPGHGNSDPVTTQEQLIDGCDAIEELCEALDLGPVPAVTSRGGQFYLIHLALRRPDLISALLCVSLPWSISPNRKESLPWRQLTFFRLALDAPAAFDVACRLGYRMVKQRGPDFYLSRGYNDSGVDSETIADPEIKPLLRAAIRHVLAQGYLAFKREQEMCAKSPISDWVRKLQVPLHWLVPGQIGTIDDTDLEHIRSLNPLVSLEFIPEAGELLPYQLPELFCERLGELVSDANDKSLALHDPVRSALLA